MQCCRVRPASSLLRSRHVRLQNHRQLSTSTLQTVTDGFLDLALALPYPESFPPYASTIILTTVLSRLFVTLPFSIWAKERQWRLEELAVPELITFRNEKAREIAQYMKNEKRWKSVEEFKNVHISRLKPIVEEHRKVLFQKHRCATTPTMVLPILSQLPLFAASTMFFSHLAHRPTPLDDESFWTLTSMARPDATATIPIALGLVTLANVETAQWFVGEEKRERAKTAKEASERRDKELEREGKMRVKPRGIIQGGLRVFSVARIIIGTMVDGSVLVYWLSSATFGLVQTWIFNWWYARKTAHLRASISR